jgi:hypothetical protein
MADTILSDVSEVENNVVCPKRVHDPWQRDIPAALSMFSSCEKTIFVFYVKKGL